MQIAIHALSGVSMFHLSVPLAVFGAVARLGLADWTTGLFTTEPAQPAPLASGATAPTPAASGTAPSAPLASGATAPTPLTPAQSASEPAQSTPAVSGTAPLALGQSASEPTLSAPEPARPVPPVPATAPSAPASAPPAASHSHRQPTPCPSPAPLSPAPGSSPHTLSVRTTEGYTISGLAGADLAATADVVVIPAWLPGQDPADSGLVPVLQKAHARGATVVGLCLGALPVIEAGLLQGRAAVGHWQALRQSAQGEAAHRVMGSRGGIRADKLPVLGGAGVVARRKNHDQAQFPLLGGSGPGTEGGRGGAAPPPQQDDRTHRNGPNTLDDLHALDDSVLYLDHGDVLTSAGAASGLDACLHLVRARLGAAAAQEVSRYLLAAPQRDGAQPQLVRRPVPAAGQDDLGAAVSWTMSWALHHLAEPLPLARLAEVAQMSTRSLVRVFRDTTGTTPAAWVRAQRVDAARHLLETTTLPVERVARTCGFGSPLALRQAFRAATGQTPSDYRKQHQHRH